MSAIAAMSFSPLGAANSFPQNTLLFLRGHFEEGKERGKKGWRGKGKEGKGRGKTPYPEIHVRLRLGQTAQRTSKNRVPGRTNLFALLSI